MSLKEIIKNTVFNDLFRSANFLLKNGSYKKWEKIWRKERRPLIICTGGYCGICDRLRGFISVYSICKKYKLGFKIIDTKSFDLRTFIEPNSYNWSIDPNDLTSNGITTKENVGVWSMGGGYIERYFIKKYLTKKITQSDVKQISVGTNVSLVRDGVKFAELFNELFRPSKLVQDQLDYYKNILGENYISVSTRFAGLIGDFNEAYNQPLPEDERQKLLNDTFVQIEKLHKKLPQKKILVCSDSITFLKMTKRLEYVVVIEGNPAHVQYSTKDDVEAHLKTFVDFFMIAGAQKIYLLISGKMYRSGFPSTAAMVNNREFKIIRF